MPGLEYGAIATNLPSLPQHAGQYGISVLSISDFRTQKSPSVLNSMSASRALRVSRSSSCRRRSDSSEAFAAVIPAVMLMASFYSVSVLMAIDIVRRDASAGHASARGRFDVQSVPFARSGSGSGGSARSRSEPQPRRLDPVARRPRQQVSSQRGWQTTKSDGLPQFPSETRLLRAGDDFVLQGGGEVAEIVAVAGYPHDQIPMLLGMRLRLAQRLRRDHVELDVMAVELEVRAH